MQRRTILAFWSSGRGWYYDVTSIHLLSANDRWVLVVLSC